MFFEKLRKPKGFTLVELIIVIVIIGILSATILPKIAGAPMQARDTGRVAELNSLDAALQSYFNDNGSYPDANANGECLSPTSTVGAKLVSGKYLLASNFPKDPFATTTTGGECTGAANLSKGSFYYLPLKSSGIDQASFLLMADVESDTKANANWANFKSFTKTTERSVVDTELAKGNESAKGALAVYVKISN